MVVGDGYAGPNLFKTPLLATLGPYADETTLPETPLASRTFDHEELEMRA